jgi:RNA polymerase sigma-32 factor
MGRMKKGKGAFMAYIDDASTQKANLGFIRDSMDAPMLERSHEQDLARRWRDHKDEKALHELVHAHHRLAVALASKFRHYGLPLGDLIQEGALGLLHAANRFDPERDIRFSTYASWWVRSTIQDYILRNWSIVRTGTTSAQKSLFFNLKRLRNRIESVSGPDITATDKRIMIAKDLGVNITEVEDMEQRMAGGDKSLNATVSIDGEEEWMALLPDSRPNPEDVVTGMKDSTTRSQWLNDALSELPERERTIIRKRHLTQEAVTLEELGATLGISKERVRQLEQRAMDRIKTSITRHVHDNTELFA